MIQTKYNSVKTIVDGIKFDSKLEAKCYELIKASGLEFELQPSFELQASFKLDGRTIRAITYKADFAIINGSNRVIIDIKGMETPVFKIKEKMLYKQHPEINFIKIKSQKEMRQFLADFI